MMFKSASMKIFAFSPVAIVAAMLTACGGGSGNGNAPATPDKPTTAISLFAGAVDGNGYIDGKADVARFGQINGMALDQAGNLYVADDGNHVIRKISAAGDVTTLAGTAGQIGLTDGDGAVARFNNLRGLTLGTGGNLYVADFSVRKISSTGKVSTLDGSGPPAQWNGQGPTFGTPYRAQSVAADIAGNVFATYTGYPNTVVQKIPATGSVSNFAGSPNNSSSTDGTGAAARLSNDGYLAADSSGNIYLADTYNRNLRKITAAGVVSTIAGSMSVTNQVDGQGLAAGFAAPAYLTVDTAGVVYMVDQNLIRRISASGATTTVAGKIGSSDVQLGALPGAVGTPAGIAVSTDGNLYVASRNAILKIKLP